ERVDADNDMRTPLFKPILEKDHAAAVKELAGLRAKTVYRPVEVLHPALLVTENPVIDVNELFGDMVRFLDRLDDTHRYRFPVPKTLHPCRQRLCGRTVPAAGVGGNDQYL